ncbi:MAG: hypothetical protein LBF37_00715 [Rickettsiales bacterium]|jgi:hypothetical protein|nr:hypothetical protein [Rickettsiales bacterium]
MTQNQARPQANKLAEYYDKETKTFDLEAKYNLYEAAVAKGTVAYKSNGQSVPLILKNLEDVDFVGGLWRVQNHFNSKIHHIRDREFVLGAQLTEKQLAEYEIKFFKYYKAAMVSENCYGSRTTGYNCIVANFHKYWAYGNNISQARAFLAVKVLDEYTRRLYDLYSSVAKKLTKQKKRISNFLVKQGCCRHL